MQVVNFKLKFIIKDKETIIPRSRSFLDFVLKRMKKYANFDPLLKFFIFNSFHQKSL